MIYIDKNESPVTPLDEKTMTSIISATPYNLYPDAAYEQFKEAYAKFYGLSPEQIIAGNGSDELIQKLMLIMPEGPAYDVELAPHILRMRTLSKAFGIAGLRLGVLISTAGTIKHIQKIEHPYPLNVFTLNIATYIFRHREETRVFLTMQRQLAEQLKQIFDTHVADKMSVFPSNANFVLTKGSAAQQLGQYVYEQGFKPRFYGEPVMKGYVRYSIATASQLKQLEEIVKEWSAKYDLSKTTKHS